MEKRPATAAEAKAMANPLRLRILRLCVDEALTNKKIAEGVGRDPGTTLHHVRQLVATGFLVAEDVRQGESGALEKPYRATGKTLALQVTDADAKADLGLATVDAFREELAARPQSLIAWGRMASRLEPDDALELEHRIDELVDDFKERDSPDGRPLALYVALHRRD
jgi:DNA-binding transcriptional ArsR family regulator